MMKNVKNKKRALIVDDNDPIRKIVALTLSSMNFIVATASSGDEGLDLFLKKPFDLVLTDLEMPGMDGWNLAFHIKGRAPKTQVVVMTGKEREVILQSDNGKFVDAVIYKPFLLEEVEDTVNRMIVDFVP